MGDDATTADEGTEGAVTERVLQTPSLRGELATRGAPRDLAVFLVVPAVLTLAWLLVDPAPKALVFDPARPTMVTAFATHYVHASTSHLVGNVVVYLLAVGVGYPLALLGGCRRVYVTLVVGVLVVFPFLLSLVHLLYLGRGPILGFSGVSLGLVGLVPPFLVWFLRSRVLDGFELVDGLSLFLLGGAVGLWQSAGTFSAAGPLAGALAVVAALAVVPVGLRLSYGRSAGTNREIPRGHLTLIAISILVVLLAAATTAPTPGTAGIPGVTVVLHLLGYVLGFVGAWSTLVYRRRRALPHPPAAEA